MSAYTITLTDREYALIYATLHATERRDRRAGEDASADEIRAVRQRLFTHVTGRAATE